MTATLTRAQQYEAQRYAADLAASRAIQRPIALARLGKEVVSCRALGAADQYAFTPDPANPGRVVFSLVLPDQASADRLHDSILGAD